MAIASNCLNKASQTSHPGNRVPYPMGPMEPHPLRGAVPANTASDVRVPAQVTLSHPLRGEETLFKGQKEQGSSFPHSPLPISLPHYILLPHTEGMEWGGLLLQIEEEFDTRPQSGHTTWCAKHFFQEYCFWEALISKATFSPFAWVGKWKPVMSFILAVTATTKSISHLHFTLGHSNATIWVTHTQAVFNTNRTDFLIVIMLIKCDLDASCGMIKSLSCHALTPTPGTEWRSCSISANVFAPGSVKQLCSLASYFLLLLGSFLQKQAVWISTYFMFS